MPKKEVQRYTLRKDGRYQKKIPVIKDGKKTYQVVYAKSQKEMDVLLDELKFQQRKGVDITSRNDTFGEWKDRWLIVKEKSVSESKYEVYT